jgi:hypothetical protein
MLSVDICEKLQKFLKLGKLLIEYKSIHLNRMAEKAKHTFLFLLLAGISSICRLLCCICSANGGEDLSS